MISGPSPVIFVCPQCRREKDFGDTHIPPLGRSYRCECGLSTVVRPTWSGGGQKTLSSSAPRPIPARTSGASLEHGLVVGVPIDAVRARLAPPQVAPAGPPTSAEIEKLFPAKTWTPQTATATPVPAGLRSRPL